MRNLFQLIDYYFIKKLFYKPFFLPFFLIFININYGQYSFDIIKTLDKEKIEGILNKIDGVQEQSDERIYNLKLFLNNPFTERLHYFDFVESIKYLDELHFRYNNAMSSGDFNENIDENSSYVNITDDILKNITQEVSTISSGFSPTTQIIDATAKLLVERTKQELTLTFYENFKNTFDNSIEIQISENESDKVYLKLKYFFPNTHQLFESQNYFQTPSFGQIWTTTFKKDINNLPYSIGTLINENTILKKSEQGYFAIVSFDLLDQLNKGNHPREIIKSICDSYSFNTYFESHYDVDKMLYFLNALSQNLTTLNSENDNEIEKWVTTFDLKKLDPTQKRLLTGLIAQKIKDKGLITNEHLKQLEYNYNSLYVLISKLQTSFINIENNLEVLKKIKPDQKQIVLEKYPEYLNQVIILFEEVYKNYHEIILNKNYYTSVFYKKYNPLMKDIMDFNIAISSKNYAESILLSSQFIQHLIPTISNDNKIIKNINYYGTFMLDVTNTIEKEGDLKSVLEHYIMPVTSYRIKRNFNSSWDVSAYPGLYIGYEFSESNSFSYGVTAPVGFSYSIKNNDLDVISKSSSSTTLFLSVIDIGAPFVYRFNNDEAQGLPENIKWEQVFSPGLFLIRGFKNSPLSIGINAQYSPLLRKIEEDNQLNDKNVFRLGFTLLVDIPLFNLWKEE